MRVQLTHAVAVLALLSVVPAERAAAQAAEPWKLSLDTLLYTDDDNVMVLTPQADVQYRFDEEGSQVSAAGSVDIVSAASVDVVSHATRRFSETRTEAHFSAGVAIDGFVPSVSYRGSFEPDYVSNGGRVGFTTRLGTPDSVLGAGYGLTHDQIGRTGTPSNVFSATLFTHAADVSLTQVFGATTLGRAGYALTIQDGYMEKPYRYVPLFTADAVARAEADGVALGLTTFDRYRLPTRPPESVPDMRVRHAVFVQLVQWIEAIESALHLDYQLYFDDWAVTAHVLEPSLDRHLSNDVGLHVGGRLYYQSSAYFWERTYVVSQPDAIPTWRTVDRDLSSYLAGSLSARIDWHLAPVTLYADATATYTSYFDFLYRDHLFALVGLVGARLIL
jgi:hypothetical protein